MAYTQDGNDNYPTLRLQSLVSEPHDASNEGGKVVQPSTSRDAMAVFSSKVLPSSSKSHVRGDEKVGNASDSTRNMEQKRGSLSHLSYGGFAATQNLAPDDSDVEVITLDASDDEGVMACGKTSESKKNPKRANAFPGSSRQQPCNTSNGKGTEDIGLEEPGPSSAASSVIRSAETQRLRADTSDIEVIQLDSDDDEQAAGNNGGGGYIQIVIDVW